MPILASNHLDAADAAAAAGALDGWVERHRAAVWRYLHFLGCTGEVGEDLMQDAFLAALRHEVPRLDHAAARAWLRTAVRNLWGMHLRRRGRRREVAGLGDLDAAWTEVVGDDDGARYAAALRACVATLDERAARAIELRYRDEASRAAMAAELGLGEPGVKQLLRRVRTRLRECVERRLQAGGRDGLDV